MKFTSVSEVKPVSREVCAGSCSIQVHHDSTSFESTRDNRFHFDSTMPVHRLRISNNTLQDLSMYD